MQEQTSEDTFGTVRIHDLESGSVGPRMEGICENGITADLESPCGRFPARPFAALVLQMSFTPDGSRLVATTLTQPGSANNPEKRRTLIWEASTGELIAEDSAYTNHEFSPDGHRLHLFGAGTMGALATDSWKLDVTAGFGCTTQVFSQNGKHLYCASDSEDAAGLTNRDTGTWAASARREESECTDLAVSPDDSVLACAEPRGAVTIYDTETLEPLQTVPVGEPVTNVEFMNNAHLLVVPRSGPGIVITTDVVELLRIARAHSTNRWGLTAEECRTHYITACPADWPSPPPRD